MLPIAVTEGSLTGQQDQSDPGRELAQVLVLVRILSFLGTRIQTWLTRHSQIECRNKLT
jgi:hypothetical protein